MAEVRSYISRACKSIDGEILTVEIEGFFEWIRKHPGPDWKQPARRCIKRILTEAQTRKEESARAGAEGRSELWTGRYQRGPNADKVRPGQKTNEYGQPLNDDGGLEVVL